MQVMSSKLTEQKSFFHRRFRLERWIAVLALINLALVFFDLSYLTVRSLYLQFTPSITQFYDPIKGIRPYPEGQAYLEQVLQLEQQVAQVGISSPQVESLLAGLRDDTRLIQVSDSNTISTINQRLRSRTAADTTFDRFWSQDHLTKAGWQSEITFWNDQIRPLIAANYYREVNRFGYAIDDFWLIDLPFMLIFAIDLFTRIRATHQRHPELSWLESALRRWYDVFLILPVWRWLRVISVTIRLYQVDLVDLEPLRAEAQRDLVISFAAELTEMVGIQVVDQLQNSIQQGEMMRWLLYPETRRDYIQVNGQSEIKVIASRLLDMSVGHVLPKVQPDIQDLVHYSVVSTVNQLPIYQQLQRLPGVHHLPEQLAENLAASLSQAAYRTIVQSLEDPVLTELTTRLSRNFRDALEEELQKKHNTKEIESLLVDMLEEIKLNYVRGISEMGIEHLVDEVEQLHRQIKA